MNRCEACGIGLPDDYAPIVIVRRRKREQHFRCDDHGAVLLRSILRDSRSDGGTLVVVNQEPREKVRVLPRRKEDQR